MIQVEIVKPDTSSELLTFDKSEVLIGRKPSNDIVLGSLDVSGNHACLQIADGQWRVVDLGSTNGTYVAGERVQMSPLGERAEVRVAGYLLRVQARGRGSSPAAPSPRAVDVADPGVAIERTILRFEGPPRGRETQAPHEAPNEPEAPPLVHGGEPPPAILLGDLGDLPPLVGGDAGAPSLADAPPLVSTHHDGAPPLATDHRGAPLNTARNDGAPPLAARHDGAPPLAARHDGALSPHGRPEPAHSARDHAAPPLAATSAAPRELASPARPADPRGPAAPATTAPAAPREHADQARASVSTTPEAPIRRAPRGPDLAAIWANPAVLRVLLREGDHLEIDRGGDARERLPLPAGVDVDGSLALLAGRRDLSHGPCSMSLVDGAALWWARGADGRLVAALERERAAPLAVADLLRAGTLDDALALRLMGALTGGRGLLFARLAGAAALPFALAIASADRRPGALVRGHVAPIALPTGAPITLLDAAGAPAQSAALALALRLGAGWIVCDEAPPADAAREVQRRGVGLCVVVDAAPDEALRRAHARVAGSPGDLDYAHLVVVAAGASGPTIDQIVDPGSEGFAPLFS